MQGRYHLALGSATGITLGLMTSNQDPFLAVITASICSTAAILPDIESKSSKISKSHKAASFFIRLFASHRGLIHTPFFLIILNFIIIFAITRYSLPWQICIAFNTGYILHLLQDSFTKRGIKWLYPFKRTNYSLYYFLPGSNKNKKVPEFILTVMIYLIVAAGIIIIVKNILGITSYGIKIPSIKLKDVLN